MKIRNGFVSNSSSSSFIIGIAEVLDKEKVVNYIHEVCPDVKIFKSPKERESFEDVLFNGDKESWHKYVSETNNQIEIFICRGIDIRNEFPKFKKVPVFGNEDDELEIENDLSVYQKEWLVNCAKTNDQEMCFSQFSKDKIYLIVNIGNDEEDAPFLGEDYYLDYSRVTEDYFKNNFKNEYNIIKLLKGIDGLTEKRVVKIGASRNG